MFPSVPATLAFSVSLFNWVWHSSNYPLSLPLTSPLYLLSLSLSFPTQLPPDTTVWETALHPVLIEWNFYVNVSTIISQLAGHTQKLISLSLSHHVSEMFNKYKYITSRDKLSTWQIEFLTVCRGVYWQIAVCCVAGSEVWSRDRCDVTVLHTLGV